MFYSALAVKHSEPINTFIRDNTTATTFDQVAADGGWLWLLQETHGFTIPTWLNRDLLGSATMSGEASTVTIPKTTSPTKNTTPLQSHKIRFFCTVPIARVLL